MATDLTGELLKAVSRSFYLTIKWLPSEMRPAVALGYMLARATDSVADTSTADPARRVHALKAMGAAVAGTLDSAGMEELFALLRGELAAAQSNPSERELLCRFSECLQALETMPAEQKALIRRVLSVIVEGQVWDLTFFDGRSSVTTDEETRNYTWMVAGCVGEFWTRLGYSTLAERYCDPSRAEVMEKAGIRYGQGLQLINILRDRQEDAGRGRSYLCSDPMRWLYRAERYMADGLDYSRRLRSFRLRFATMLPALIGQKTLELLKESKSDERVKIPRRSVYCCLVKAIFISLLPRAF